jgi:hypothetical protein
LSWVLIDGGALRAQTNGSPVSPDSTATNRAVELNPAERVEDTRIASINSRRRICGRIVQILPDGLVVDSGYLSLLRPELGRYWLIRGNVVAKKTENLVEENTPGAVCSGLVFIGDLPKRPKAKLYDYVVLQGYPVGTKTYLSLGTIQRTVRKYSAALVKAVDANLQLNDSATTNSVMAK